MATIGGARAAGFSDLPQATQAELTEKVEAMPECCGGQWFTSKGVALTPAVPAKPASKGHPAVPAKAGSATETLTCDSCGKPKTVTADVAA